MQVNIINATATQLRSSNLVNLHASTTEARNELLLHGYEFIVYDDCGTPTLQGTSIQKALASEFDGYILHPGLCNFDMRIKTAPTTLSETRRLITAACRRAGFKSQGPKLFPKVDAGAQVFFIEKQLAGGCTQRLEIRLAGTAIKPLLEISGDVFED